MYFRPSAGVALGAVPAVGAGDAADFDALALGGSGERNLWDDFRHDLSAAIVEGDVNIAVLLRPDVDDRADRADVRSRRHCDIGQWNSAIGASRRGRDEEHDERRGERTSYRTDSAAVPSLRLVARRAFLLGRPDGFLRRFLKQPFPETRGQSSPVHAVPSFAPFDTMPS